MPQKIHRRTFQFVTNFGYRKFLLSWGLFHVILLQFFFSQYPKTLEKNISALCFRKNPVPKEFLDNWRGRGGVVAGSIENFRQKMFVSYCQKKFCRGNFGVGLISGIEKLYESEGVGGREEVLRYFVGYLLSHSAEKICRRPF